MEKLLKAVKSLVSDIESMQVKPENPDAGLYWFGPFSEAEDACGDQDSDVSIEWPNLAISLDEVKKVIAEIEKVTIIEHQQTISGRLPVSPEMQYLITAGKSEAVKAIAAIRGVEVIDISLAGVDYSELEKRVITTYRPTPHWHKHNPWKDRVVYVPLNELVECISHAPGFYQTLTGNLDAYILPNGHGDYGHSIGIRYGKEGPDYYSPLGDRKKVQALLDKYQVKP
jgi:hypothetical protein